MKEVSKHPESMAVLGRIMRLRLFHACRERLVTKLGEIEAARTSGIHLAKARGLVDSLLK